MANHSYPTKENLYPYSPSKILPIIFAILIAVSLVAHTFQNFRYRFWRITFFLFYANIIFLTGWILRTIAAHNTSSLPLYIAETIFVYAGPPIYAAAEYNILGRLMHYLPMHASLNPNMVKYFFIYLGALVEALTAAGAAKMASSDVGSNDFVNAGKLLAVATLLQGGVEIVYMSMVALLHYRCAKSGMLARNVKVVCFTLYGCSLLVLLRSVFRGVEAFEKFGKDCIYCGSVATQEWYLFALEAAPMVVYTIWLNIVHPGRFLPAESKRYLDVDGKTERMGPGWIDERPGWKVLLDPFNLLQDKAAGAEHTQFWRSPEKWMTCDRSFAMGTGSNRAKREVAVQTSWVGRRKTGGRESSPVDRAVMGEV